MIYHGLSRHSTCLLPSRVVLVRFDYPGAGAGTWFQFVGSEQICQKSCPCTAPMHGFGFDLVSYQAERSAATLISLFALDLLLTGAGTTFACHAGGVQRQVMWCRNSARACSLHEMAWLCLRVLQGLVCSAWQYPVLWHRRPNLNSTTICWVGNTDVECLYFSLCAQY